MVFLGPSETLKIGLAQLILLPEAKVKVPPSHPSYRSQLTDKLDFTLSIVGMGPVFSILPAKQEVNFESSAVLVLWPKGKHSRLQLQSSSTNSAALASGNCLTLHNSRAGPK